jgi:protein TonB
MSLALHALAAGVIVASPSASRKAPPPEPMHLVFVDLLPPRGGVTPPGPAVETLPPPVAVPVPETRAATRPQKQLPRREPVREPAKERAPLRPPKPAPTRAPEPLREGGLDGERTGESALAPSDVSPAPGGVAPGTGGTPKGAAARVYAAGAVPVPPVLLTREMPAYPTEARRREVEGVVLVEAIVDADGRVEPGSLKVRESVTLLDGAAVDAVSQWRFRPGRDRSGTPVRVILEIPVRFVLR